MAPPIDLFRYRTFFVRATANVARKDGEFWIANGVVTYLKPGTNFLDQLGYEGWELISITEIGGSFFCLAFKQPYKIITLMEGEP